MHRRILGAGTLFAFLLFMASCFFVVANITSPKPFSFGEAWSLLNVAVLFTLVLYLIVEVTGNDPLG